MRNWLRRLMPDRRFLGSTLAITAGVMYLLSAPASFQTGGGGAGLIGGPVIILGAVAYRSRKRRLLGLARSMVARKIVEVLALVAILLVVRLQQDPKILIATDPVTNLALPLCAFIAYFCAGILTKPS